MKRAQKNNNNNNNPFMENIIIKLAISLYSAMASFQKSLFYNIIITTAYLPFAVFAYYIIYESYDIILQFSII